MTKSRWTHQNLPLLSPSKCRYISIVLNKFVYDFFHRKSDKNFQGPKIRDTMVIQMDLCAMNLRYIFKLNEIRFYFFLVSKLFRIPSLHNTDFLLIKTFSKTRKEYGKFSLKYVLA